MLNLKIVVFCRVCEISLKPFQLLFSLSLLRNFKLLFLYPVTSILGRNIEGKSIPNSMHIFIMKNNLNYQQNLCIIPCVYSVMSKSLRPINCSPPGFSVYGIFQARILEWVPSSYSMDGNGVSCISCTGMQILYYCAIWDSLAAAAESLQSCPTLCDPIDSSPPGSSDPGILQARTLEWVAVSFSNACKWSRSVVSDSSRPHGLQPTRLLCPWDFPGKSTGVGCHFLLPGLSYHISIPEFLPWDEQMKVRG